MSKLSITIEKDINWNNNPSTMEVTDLKWAISQAKKFIQISQIEIKWFDENTSRLVREKADNRIYYWQDILAKLNELNK